MRFQDWSSIGPIPFCSQHQMQDKFSADWLRCYVHNAVIHYQFGFSFILSFSLFSNAELIPSFPAWVLPLAVHLSQTNLILPCLWFWPIHIYTTPGRAKFSTEQAARTLSHMLYTAEYEKATTLFHDHLSLCQYCEDVKCHYLHFVTLVTAATVKKNLQG